MRVLRFRRDGAAEGLHASHLLGWPVHPRERRAGLRILQREQVQLRAHHLDAAQEAGRTRISRSAGRDPHGRRAYVRRGGRHSDRSFGRNGVVAKPLPGARPVLEPNDGDGYIGQGGEAVSGPEGVLHQGNVARVQSALFSTRVPDRVARQKDGQLACRARVSWIRPALGERQGEGGVSSGTTPPEGRTSPRERRGGFGRRALRRAGGR